MNGDAVSVRRAAAGDGEQLDELLRRWMGAVYGRAWRALGDADRAADVCQEVMLAVVRGLPSLADPERFPGWLRRITERQIQRARRPAEPCSDGLEAVSPSPESIVVDRVHESQLRELVTSALAGLPPRSRLAVELFYYRGLSCRQVAEFLGSTRGAVKVLLYTARREMREMIDTQDTPAAEPLPRIGSSCLSGSEAERVPLHDHHGPAARLFCALYPRGTLGQAAARAGVPLGEAELVLGQLLEAHFVARDDGEVRCLVPLLLPTDWELLKPWLHRAADATMPLIEPIARSAEQVAEHGRDEAERAMLRHVLTVPLGTFNLFLALAYGFGEAPPDRGPSGHYLVGYVDERVTEYRSGWRGGFSDHGDDQRWSAIAAPCGMDYRRRDALEAGPPESAPFGCHMISDALLWGLVDEPLTDGRLEELAVHTPQLSAEALRQVLLDSRLVLETPEGLRHNLPILPIEAHRAHVQVCHELGEHLLELLPDLVEDLRARIAETSFRDANYLDAAFVCVQLLKDEVDHRLIEAGPPYDPAGFPPNWGIVLAR
ncbi:MAG: sigma-70 family RNA polymerase sigma factor [Armatimonadetes bacterium]|nr:sigma-70 family RNA polymerase sigma factor [Armatimonadota bacterium]